MGAKHLLLVAALAVAPVAAGNSGDRHAVVARVDCDAGDDLAEALAGAIRRADGPGRNERSASARQRARPVVLEISGTCMTNLVVDRDRVTLRGSEGQTTVLQNAIASDNTSAPPVVDVRYAQDIVLENLVIENGWIGIRVLYSGATIRRSLLRSNVFGVSSDMSNVLVVETVLRGERYAVASEGAGRTEIRDCSIEESSFGVFAVGASVVVIDGGSIRDCGSGVTAAVATVALVNAAEIEFGRSVTGDALLVTQNAEVIVSDATLVGNAAWITIERGGTLRAEFGLTTEGPVQVRGGGKLFTVGGSLTDVWLSDLSLASIRGTSVSGTLGCLFGSDAICPFATIGNVQGCRSCPSAEASSAEKRPELVETPPEREPTDFESTLRAFRQAKTGG